MASYWKLGEDLPDEEDLDDGEDTLGLRLFSWRPGRRYVLGLDLGQTQDHTALAIVQRSGGNDPVVQVRYLQRFALGTAYPTIVQRVAELMATPLLRAQAALVVDKTGVGGAVVDLLTDAHLAPVAITITAGHQVHRESKIRYNVPKRELVGCLQVLLQTGRLKIASALPESEILVKELLNFQVKITASANDVYGAWRENAHDDLVLALSLAVWYSQHG